MLLSSRQNRPYLFAAAGAVAAAAYVYLYLTHLDARAPVLIISSSLPPGTVIESFHLRTVNWPLATRLSGVVRSARDAVGRALTVGTVPGQPLLTAMLAPPGSGGPASLVSPDRRLVYLSASDVRGLGPDIGSGALVDVVAVLTGEGDDPSARIVLEGLTVAQVVGNRNEEEGIYLAAYPEEVEMLAWFLDAGQVFLAIHGQNVSEAGN